MSQIEIVSIIIPCRNEELFIQSCLESVLAFEAPAHVQTEVLVLEGRSSDRTREIAERFAAAHPNVRVLDNPGVIQSTAVNIGVRAARGLWIMRLDAHARYPANYMSECLATARRSGAENVGGLFIAELRTETYQAKVIQALTTHKFGVGDAGYRTGAKEAFADTVPYGFFPRSVFSRLGWFDERLDRAQDYEFNARIRAAGGRILRNPNIRVFYYNQDTLSRFFSKQFFREAPYNAYLWYLAPYAFAWRHCITGIFAAGVILGPIVGSFVPALFWVYLAIMLLYFTLGFTSAVQQTVRYRVVWHIVVLPPLFFSYHFVHGVGIWAGLARLLFRRAPVQRKAEPWAGAGRLRAWPH